MLRAVLFEPGDTLTRLDDEEGLALASTTHALLDALRERGLRVALVAARAEPPELEARVDAVAPSLDAALAAVDASPAEALWVGAGAAGVREAAARGLATAQAYWFRADEDGGAGFSAFTQMDIINLVKRLGD